jgi:hypothetical protein
MISFRSLNHLYLFFKNSALDRFTILFGPSQKASSYQFPVRFVNFDESLWWRLLNDFSQRLQEILDLLFADGRPALKMRSPQSKSVPLPKLFDETRRTLEFSNWKFD